MLLRRFVLSTMVCLSLFAAQSSSWADSFSQFMACSGAFDTGLGNCAQVYSICMDGATTEEQADACGRLYAGCGSGQVSTYSHCIGSMRETINQCDQARAAKDQCESDMIVCSDAEADSPETFSCGSSYSTCLNASGIWRCE